MDVQVECSASFAIAESRDAVQLDGLFYGIGAPASRLVETKVVVGRDIEDFGGETGEAERCIVVECDSI